ncbi:MAG: hypothetical protein RIC24_13530 [Hyphomicrobiales bacterium]
MGKFSEGKYIHNYDRDEHFYLSTEEANRDPLGGGILVPAHATTVAPPKKWPKGKVPVFNGERWEISDDNFWRPRTEEVNYDAGRPMSSYTPLFISHHDFPIYPSVRRLASSYLVVDRIVECIRYIDAKFAEIVEMHRVIKEQSRMIPDHSGPTVLSAYKFECEALVFQMRHCLDALCRLTELLCCADQIDRDKAFRCESVGSILRMEKNNPMRQIVIGIDETYVADQTNFLKISNQLFNAMKHIHMNAETQILVGVDVPTIVAYRGPLGAKRNLVQYHNHNAYHLMMGFHDSVRRIIENQKTYIALGSNEG